MPESASGGVYLVLGGVLSPGGCLVQGVSGLGVSGPGGCLLGGCQLLGVSALGVSAPGGVCSSGGLLLGGVSQHAQRQTPPCEQNHRHL